MDLNTLSIDSPEQVPLEFALAGIGSRFLALALDTLIQAGAVVLLIAVGLGVGVWLSALNLPQARLWVAAAVIFAWFALNFGYFALFEAIWNGQTPGKRYLHLRVIKDTGRPITAFDALARNLLRLVDSLPQIYAVGILTVLLSGRSKRLGDFVAGTVVVQERTYSAASAAAWSFGEQAASAPAAYDASLLSSDEFQVIEAFLLRRSQLGPALRSQMAHRILDRVGPKLGISREDHAHPERLLQSLAADYRNRSRFAK
jgi:uncharacterized RDD family membrane protein YckC